VLTARKALDDHIAALNGELAPMRLLAAPADFAGAIKGLRSIASMQDALDTTLAGTKIAADTQARGIRANVQAFKANAEGLEFLFADLGQIVHKAADDFAAVLQARITTHKASETARDLKRKADELAAQQAESARLEQLAVERRQAAEIAAANAAGARLEAIIAKAPAAVPPAAQAPAPAPTMTSLRGMAATLTVGQIQERLAPLKIDAAGLQSLGFVRQQRPGAATHFLASDWDLIKAAIIKHLQSLK